MHSKRKREGLEHIDRDVKEILKIMQQREQAALAATAQAVTRVHQQQQEQAAQDVPCKVPSPCGTKTGIMVAGRVVWIDGNPTAWEIVQDEHLGLPLILIRPRPFWV